MQNDILISIIVPIYNVKDYLPKCIESICKQTYKKLEIILVDDGSTDGSSKLCDTYANNDSRIIVVHKENGGLVSARKTGAKVATGNYITNVDGDDWIAIDRIEKILPLAIPSGADMIYFNGRSNQYGERVTTEKPDITEGLYSAKKLYPLLQDLDCCFNRKLIPSMGCWVVKKDLYQKIQFQVDDRISIAEDQTFLWLCLLEARTVYVVEDTGYYYVMRNTSLTHASGKVSKTPQLSLVYHTIRDALDIHHCQKNMYLRLVFAMTKSLMESDYSSLCTNSSNFLYPYPSVKIGSRIIIYGAGVTGTLMMESLAKNDNYTVCAWVDLYERNKTVNGFCPREPEYINEVSFDYIIVALVNAKISNEVRDYLTGMGIDSSKIACMNPNIIDKNMLENCLEVVPAETSSAQNPLLSIIVPIYNVEAYLTQCIQSICNQSYSNLEIILVDDGSTDFSGNICDIFAEKDSRIKVIHQKNGGLVVARKAGLSIANGSYIGFVDGDDYIDTNMYAILLNRIGDADFIHTGFYENNVENISFYDDSIELIEENKYKILRQLLRGYGRWHITPSIWSKLFRAELVKNAYLDVPNSQSYGEDLIFLCVALCKSKKIILMAQAYYHYRILPNSLSHKAEPGDVQKTIQLYQHLQNTFMQNELMDDFYNELNYFLERQLFNTFRRLKNPFAVEQYSFSNLSVLDGKKIILYGAGLVGRDYYSQLSRYPKCEIVAWLDKNMPTYGDIQTSSPELTYNINYDLIVIAVLSQKTADMIINTFIEQGIPASKLIWQLPDDVFGEKYHLDDNA